MPKEEDERIWREFIENGGNLKNQTERIKKDLAKRKSNLVEKKRRNLPKPANLTKRLIKKIATKKIQINSTLDLHGHNKTSAKLKFTIVSSILSLSSIFMVSISFCFSSTENGESIQIVLINWSKFRFLIESSSIK